MTAPNVREPDDPQEGLRVTEESQKLDALYSDIAAGMRSHMASPLMLMEEIGRRAASYRIPPAQGQQYTMEDVNRVMQRMSERVRVINETPDIASTIAVNLAQGMTFGLLDDAVRLFAPETGEELRRVQKVGRTERPKTSFASELLGGLIAPGATMGTGVRSGATAARMIRGAAGAGALEGAAFGLGESEGTASERAKATAIGLVGGGVLGSAAGGAVHAGRGVARYVAGRSGRTAEEATRNFVQGVAERSPRGIDGILEDLRRGKNLVPEFQLADVAEMRPVLAGASRASREARGLVDVTLPPRAREAAERTNRMLSETLELGNLPETLKTRAADLIERRVQGSQAYKQITNEMVDVEDLADFVSLRGVKKAWRAANNRLSDWGRELMPLTRKVENEAGEIVEELTDSVNYGTLQHISNEMTDKMNRLYRTGSNEAARTIKEVRDDFNTTIRERVMRLGDAQRNWHELSEIQRAIDAGGNFMTPKNIALSIQDDMSRFTGEAREAYREAAAESIAAGLRKRKRSLPVSSVLDSPEMTAKMHELYPDPEAHQTFMAALSREDDMYQTLQLTHAGKELPVPDLVGELQEGAGARTMQRIATMLAAFKVGSARLGAEAHMGMLGTQAREKAQDVGGRVAHSLLDTGEARSMDVLDLMMGKRGGIRPGTPSFLALRSPLAIAGAGRNIEENR